MKRWLLIMALCACQKASEERREMPKLPPPPQAKVTPSLRIEVEVDGKAQSPLDAERLAKAAPDFTDGEHKAWRFSTLLGTTIAPGTSIAVTGAQNVTITLKQPQNSKDPQPVITESRRGEIVAALISPEDPFPAFHGQGRRLARPMDPLPRISGVTKISVKR
jgi:hypothetical protein